MSVSVYDKTTGQLTPIAGVPAIKLAALTRDIAVEEKMNVASQDYNIGDYIIRSDDKLYKTLTPITQGDVWENDVNIKEVTLANEVKNNFDVSLNCLTNSIEHSNIATRIYSKDEYLYYIDTDGIAHYARVAQPIAIGNPFINGTNVNNITVGSELSLLNEALGSAQRTPDFMISSTGETGMSTYGDLLKEIVNFLRQSMPINYFFLSHKCYIVEARDNDFITYKLNENTGDRISFSFVSAFSGGGTYITVRTISLGLTDGDLYRASNTTGSTKITNQNIGQGNRLEFYFY